MGGRWSRRIGSVVVGVIVVASACGGSSTDLDTERIEPGLVEPADVGILVDDGVTVIDVRTPDEFADGHLADATLIDFYEEGFAAQISGLDRDGRYLVYCRSGNRSGQAVALMDELGFDEVFDLDGGVIAYEAAGFPLVP